MVIDAAQSVVKATGPFKGKHGIAAHPDVKDLNIPVQLWRRGDNGIRVIQVWRQSGSGRTENPHDV